MRADDLVARYLFGSRMTPSSWKALAGLRGTSLRRAVVVQGNRRGPYDKLVSLGYADRNRPGEYYITRKGLEALDKAPTKVDDRQRSLVEDHYRSHQQYLGPGESHD